MQEDQHDLGMFNQETMAARAFDVATLHINGPSADTNFPTRYTAYLIATLQWLA